MSFISLNICSLNSSYEEFVSFIDSFSHPVSVICLQEARVLRENSSAFDIPGYTMICDNPVVSSAGGLVTYIRDDFEITIKKCPVDHSLLWESHFLEISHKDLSYKTLIGNIYRPPRSNSNLATFKDEFSRICNHFSNLYRNMIILGDFNINLLNIRNNYLFEQFYDDIISYGFFPKITIPTRYNLNARTATLIDQIYVKHSDLNNGSIAGVLEVDISDHYPIFSLLKTSINPESSHTIEIKSNWVDNLHNILHDLAQIDCDDLIDDPTNDYENKFNNFMDKINTIVRKYSTSRTVHFHKHKHSHNTCI